MHNSRRYIGQNRQNPSSGSSEVRRRRTLTAVTCESLEGRKLMTGFAGAAAAEGMMPPKGSAEMGGMTGEGTAQVGDSIRFKGQRDPTTTADSTPGGDVATTTATPSGADGMSSTFDVPGRGGRAANFANMRRGDFDPTAVNDATIADNERHPLNTDGQPGGAGNQSDMGAPTDMPMVNYLRPEVGGDATTGNTALDTALAKLRTDEQATHDKSEVTPVLMAAVRKGMAAIDQAKTGDADATALQSLKTDQETIFAAQTAPTDAQQTQLQADRDAVLKSQGVSQDLIDQLAAAQLAVKTASHLTADDQTLLDADHQAIATAQAAASPSDTATTDTAATPTDTTAEPDTTATAMTDTATPTSTLTDATPTTPPSVPAPTAPATDSTAPADTTMATTSIDPRISQTASPAAMGGVMHPGPHGTQTRHGRPMGPGFAGGSGQHAQVPIRAANHGRRGGRN